MGNDDIVNAEPAGGWTSAENADDQTKLSSADAAAMLQEEAPDIEVGEAGEPDPVSADVGAGTDPDLLTDDQAQR